MKNQAAAFESGVSRRHFLLTICLAVTLGIQLMTGTRCLAQARPASTRAAQRLCLWYDRPAETWMTEALPIGNGPMGAMLFGNPENGTE